MDTQCKLYKRCLTYHPVSESELPGAEYSVALLREVGDLVLAVLLTRLDVRPVLAATNFAPFNYLRQHHNQCTALLPYHLPVCECMIFLNTFRTNSIKKKGKGGKERETLRGRERGREGEREGGREGGGRGEGGKEREGEREGEGGRERRERKREGERREERGDHDYTYLPKIFASVLHGSLSCNKPDDLSRCENVHLKHKQQC